MPFTFFAHQGPFLPLARRWPGSVDGVTLVIGSMSPDFAYVANGSRFDVWAHGFPGVVAFCVPVTLLVAWLVVRVMAPVVPDHLPGGGAFHLRELRGLAVHRFRPARAVVWAQLGALSHVGLDEFTHDWGWFARHVSWYDQRLVGTNWLGREWTVFRVVQYVGHVGGSALCVWLLWRYGRARWMRARALAVAVPSVSIRSHAALWVPTALGFGAAGAWVRLHGAGSATDILRLAAGAFVGLLAGSLAVPRLLGAPGRRGES